MSAFYRQTAPDRFDSLPTTAGPWGPDSQHGGPPAALLARAMDGVGGPEDRVVGRFTMELLGPVPVGPLQVEAEVVRPGRSVELRRATVYDERAGRPCAIGRAWLFPATGEGPARADGARTHRPGDGVEQPMPASWSAGYLDAVEWRWISGTVLEPGPAVVWMRPRADLVEGEAMTAVQRLLCCVDSASGVSAALDPAEWLFLNTELTVHLLRPPTGDWVCLEARTTLDRGSVGIAAAEVYDERGLVARSAQALLVTRR